MCLVARLIAFMGIIVLVNSETTIPWFGTAHAVFMDYNVHIKAGKEYCYFQNVEAGTKSFVSFQVLRGGDGKAGLAVRNPEGRIINPYEWSQNADYHYTSDTDGYYSICIDNRQFFGLSTKLVNLYGTIIKSDQWKKNANHLQEVDVSIGKVSHAFTRVEKDINKIQHYQHLITIRKAQDLDLLLDKKSYVQWWSILQLVVIVVTTIIQVYFVKICIFSSSEESSRLVPDNLALDESEISLLCKIQTRPKTSQNPRLRKVHRIQHKIRLVGRSAKLQGLILIRRMKSQSKIGRLFTLRTKSATDQKLGSRRVDHFHHRVRRASISEKFRALVLFRRVHREPAIAHICTLLTKAEMNQNQRLPRQ